MDKVKRSTLTEKQIKAKLSSLLYSFEEGDIGYDLLDGGYIESDAEGTELEPYVRNAKSALEELINKFDDMCEQYGLDDLTEEDLEYLEVDIDEE